MSIVIYIVIVHLLLFVNIVHLLLFVNIVHLLLFVNIIIFGIISYCCYLVLVSQ